MLCKKFAFVACERRDHQAAELCQNSAKLGARVCRPVRSATGWAPAVARAQGVITRPDFRGLATDAAVCLALGRKSLITQRMTRIADPRSTSSSCSELSELTPDSRVRVRVRRPKQQVVVRAGSAPSKSTRWSKSATPTLIGLDVREQKASLPDLDAGGDTGWGDLENDWEGETKTLLALKRRPGVLREGADEALVEEYRRQAQAILDSGLFGPR